LDFTQFRKSIDISSNLTFLSTHSALPSLLLTSQSEERIDALFRIAKHRTTRDSSLHEVYLGAHHIGRSGIEPVQFVLGNYSTCVT